MASAIDLFHYTGYRAPNKSSRCRHAFVLGYLELDPVSTCFTQLIDVIQEDRQETVALLDGPFQNLARGYLLAFSCQVRNAETKAENRPEF